MQVKFFFMSFALFSSLTVVILLLIQLYLHLYGTSSLQGVSHFYFNDGRIEVNAEIQTVAYLHKMQAPKELQSSQ